jgi:hypothetical protein
LAQGSRRWTLQQVDRYLGYTCRGDRAVEKTARDPKPSFSQIDKVSRNGADIGGIARRIRPSSSGRMFVRHGVQ